jgi:hypothetical protein
MVLIERNSFWRLLQENSCEFSSLPERYPETERLRSSVGYIYQSVAIALCCSTLVS